MSEMPWVKMFTEMLDDTKLGRLNNAVRWRFVSLILLAGECDAEGYLTNGSGPMSTEDIAWRLRCHPAKLAKELDTLSNVGLIANTDGGWKVIKFSERQGRTQSERRQMWRERQSKRRHFDGGPSWKEDDNSEKVAKTPEKTLPVTRDSRVSHVARGEKRREEKRREETPAGAPPPKTNRKADTHEHYPAVQTFTGAAHFTPATALHQSMHDAIGEKPEDLKFWAEVVTAWIAKGWNPRNIAGMYDYFKRRELPAGSKPVTTPASELRRLGYTDANGKPI
jgi:hypothetical protein